MQAVILAGGLGTRLRAAIGDYPKPMADISGKPFLEYILNLLKKGGMINVLLLVGYKHQIIEEYFGDGSKFGLKIKYSVESEPLGTGGALLNAFDMLEDEFILLNGDTFFDIQFELLEKYIRLRKPSALVTLRYTDNVERYGFVEIDEQGVVAKFIEKGNLPVDYVDGYINGGIYYFKKSIIQNFLNLKDQKVSLENDILPNLVKQKKLVGLPTGGKFIDIGIPEDYESAKSLIPKWILERRIPALFIDRDGTIIEDPGYVYGTNLTFKKEGLELIKKANQDGKLVILITNQAGIAKGKFTETQSIKTNEYIVKYLSSIGLKIDAYYYCPYHPDGVIEKWRKHSLARKPNPGMVLKACEDFRIDLLNSEVVGDNPEVDNIKIFGPMKLLIEHL